MLVERTQHDWSVAGAARAAGLSVRQAYRWRARDRTGGAAALCDRGSVPRHCRRQTPEGRVAEIAGLRRQRLSGPAIAARLGMAVSTVGKVLRRLGLGRLSALDPKPPAVRYERQRPGELIRAAARRLGATPTSHPAQNPRCLVRPKGPLLRPDLLSPINTGAGRGKERRGDRP